MHSLRAAQAEQQRNREAESAHVRKTVWGEQGNGASEDAEDDMGHTILGDVNHPAPIIMPQQSSSLAPVAILLAGLLAGGASGAAAGYFLSPSGKGDADENAPAFEDESVSIGLGRIEDYLQE